MGVSPGGFTGTVVVTLDCGTGLVCPDEAADLVVTIEVSEETGTGTGTGVLDVVETCGIFPICGTGTGVSVGAEGGAGVGCGGGTEGGRGVSCGNGTGVSVLVRFGGGLSGWLGGWVAGVF